MKRMILAAALAAAALCVSACTGCAPLTALTSNDRAVAGSTLVDEKVVFAAEAGVFGADAAAQAALDAGLLVKGSAQAVAIADKLELAHNGLKAVRAAYRAGDATTLAARLKEAQAAYSQAWALIPKKET